MARVQHTCTGCVPIDAAIIEVYIQLLGLKDSTIEAAERAEHAAEYAIGKSPYIGENGDWWEWNDEQGVFIDTGVQAQGSIAVDNSMSSTSTNPVQNKVITAAVNEKQDALVSGTNIKTVNGESLLGGGNIVAGDPNAVKYVEQTLTDSQKTQARSNIGAGTYSKAGSGIPKSDLSSAVQTSLGKADTAIQDISGKQDVITDLATIRSGAAAGATAYQKPASGVPASDMASGVQTSLGKADTAYQKPVSGIPKTDIASGVIPDVSQFVTASVNNLVNYYLKSETYTKAEVQALIAAIDQFSYEVAASLPTASASTMNKIYLVPSSEPKTQNTKDEFITLRSGSAGSYTYSWEQIGSTAIDLSGYVTPQQLNTALAAYTTTASLTTLLAAKQDVVADLATIRSGAAAGATAYQKPASGIPASDLASGVIPDVSGKQDALVSGTNIKTINQDSLLGSGDITIEDGVGFESIETPQTPDGTALITLTNGDTITLSLNHEHPQYYSKEVEASNPSGGFLPDVVYSLGTLTGTVTFALAAAVTGNVNHYFWTFDTGSIVPTVTWPTGITWASGSAPTFASFKHYEISVLNGIAYYSEV